MRRHTNQLHRSICVPPFQTPPLDLAFKITWLSLPFVWFLFDNTFPLIIWSLIPWILYVFHIINWSTGILLRSVLWISGPQYLPETDISSSHDKLGNILCAVTSVCTGIPVLLIVHISTIHHVHSLLTHLIDNCYNFYTKRSILMLLCEPNWVIYIMHVNFPFCSQSFSCLSCESSSLQTCSTRNCR